jgi:hypothetical protein
MTTALTMKKMKHLVATSRLLLISTTAEASYYTPTYAARDTPKLTPAIQVAAAPTADGSSFWETHNTVWIVVLAVLGTCICLVWLCLTCAIARRRQQQDNSQRRMINIFKYLTFFDVDDFDIRHSPTGGFHATYLNELSDGINNSNELTQTSSHDEDERSFLSNSSVPGQATRIVEDNLFMTPVPDPPQSHARMVQVDLFMDDDCGLSLSTEGDDCKDDISITSATHLSKTL